MAAGQTDSGAHELCILIDTDVDQENPMVQRAVLHAVADRLTGASALPTVIDLRGIDFTLDVKRL